MTSAGFAVLAYVIALSMMLLYGLGIWRQRRRLLRRAERDGRAATAAPPAREPSLAAPAATSLSPTK